MPDFALEKKISDSGCGVAGIDEVGRGPWAGPVVAAAFMFLESPPRSLARQIDDSKALPLLLRLEVAANLGAYCAQGRAIFAIGVASVEEIDRFNILQATFLAMQRALKLLPQVPIAVLIDGNKVPVGLPCPATAVIGGDRLSLSIAAASIMAKVHRDELMGQLARDHPGYGWETNAGYGTRKHQEALLRLGVTPHHRRSFAPIRNLLKYNTLDEITPMIHSLLD
ncbi:MAG: ribonuclease HII [Alphaproteobacteria bacterium]